MLRLHVCDTTYNFSDRIEDSYLFGFSWNVGFNWPPGITRTLRLSLPPNRAATGAPVISGTAQVGEELTALTDGIMDEDGLDNVFNYQWGRMDGTNETDLPDATSGTYTLTRDDVGKTLKVRVSFTDLLDSKETRPSQGFFLPNTAPTAADNAVMTDEDTAYTFTASDFSFADADGDTIASLPTAGTLVLDDTAVTLGQSVPAADIGKLRFTPTANDSGDAYASFTFRVSDGTEESASAYTMTVNVTAMNDPATGAPTISGTAQVGQTLTAATAGIADVDGLTSPTYSYQWIRVDGADETNIGGATSATYTPVQDDVGKALKVRAGFAEKRTSAPTAAVTAAPATCPAPDFAGRRKIWTGVLTLGDFTYSPASYRGYGRFPDAGGDGGGLDPATFTVGSNEHEVEILALGTRLDFALRAGTGWRDTNAAALRLHVCNANFDFSDSNFTVDGPSGIVFPFHSWDTDLDWSSVSTRTVHLNLPQNRAATGAPGDYRHGRGRAVRRRIHLPVGAGGRRRHVERGGHLRRNCRHLHPDRRRPGQEGQSRGESHRRLRQRRATHQRADGNGDRGGRGRRDHLHGHADTRRHPGSDSGLRDLSGGERHGGADGLHGGHRDPDLRGGRDPADLHGVDARGPHRRRQRAGAGAVGGFRVHRRGRRDVDGDGVDVPGRSDDHARAHRHGDGDGRLHHQLEVPDPAGGGGQRGIVGDGHGDGGGRRTV